MNVRFGSRRQIAGAGTTVVLAWTLISLTAIAVFAIPTVSIAGDLTATYPDLKVGDKWKVERRDAFNKLMFSEETIVTSVSPTTVEISINGSPGRMKPDLTLLDGPRGLNDPGYQFLSFPIEVGKKWSFKTKWLIKSNNATGTAQFDVEVKGMESVKVPAGEFQAYKLESSGYVNPSSGGSFGGTATYWYAPKAKTVVRVAWISGSNGYVQDLIQVTLSP